MVLSQIGTAAVVLFCTAAAFFLLAPVITGQQSLIFPVTGAECFGASLKELFVLLHPWNREQRVISTLLTVTAEMRKRSLPSVCIRRGWDAERWNCGGL